MPPPRVKLGVLSKPMTMQYLLHLKKLIFFLLLYLLVLFRSIQYANDKRNTWLEMFLRENYNSLELAFVFPAFIFCKPN